MPGLAVGTFAIRKGAMLASSDSWTVTLCIAPALLFALSVVPQFTPNALAAVGGLAAVAGGALWKFVLVTRACHQQGFALPMVPQRGSGMRAAPHRLALAR